MTEIVAQQSTIWTKTYQITIAYKQLGSSTSNTYHCTVIAHVKISDNKYRLEILMIGVNDELDKIHVSTKWKTPSENLDHIVNELFHIYGEFSKIGFDINCALFKQSQSYERLFTRYYETTLYSKNSTYPTSEIWLTCEYNEFLDIKIERIYLAYECLSCKKQNVLPYRLDVPREIFQLSKFVDDLRKESLNKENSETMRNMYSWIADTLVKHFYRYYKLKILEILPISGSLARIIAEYLVYNKVLIDSLEQQGLVIS